MIDELNARNELCSMFSAGWLSADWSALQNGVAPNVIYDGRDTGEPLNATLPVVKVFIEPLFSDQSSLADHNGENKYKNGGLMTVQTFGVLTRGDGLEMAEYMAIIAKRIYQGRSSPNGIWFRKCSINKIGASGGWFQFNTLIEFEFDEMR